MKNPVYTVIIDDREGGYFKFIILKLFCTKNIFYYMFYHYDNDTVLCDIISLINSVHQMTLNKEKAQFLIPTCHW